jgi:hypothetical protein
MLIFTETFLSTSTPDAFVNIPSYNLIRRDRITSSGGGIAIYFSQNTPLCLHSTSETHEYMWLKMTFPSTVLFLCVAYRPPDHDDSIYDKILSDIDSILTSSPKAKFAVCGDFNCHHAAWLGVGNKTDGHGHAAFAFSQLASLSQCIDSPTRYPTGNMLETPHSWTYSFATSPIW